MQSAIKYIMPNLHNSGILKAVHRTLEGYDGPKKSTRLIDGRQMSDAMLGLWKGLTPLAKRTNPSRGNSRRKKACSREG